MRKLTRSEWISIILMIVLIINMAFMAYRTWGPPLTYEPSPPNVVYNGTEMSCMKNEAQSNNDTLTWDCSPKKAA